LPAFVLAFTTLLPGPLAALMLAEAGAEVVKIERPPAGDEMRGYLPHWGDDSTNFALLNPAAVAAILRKKPGEYWRALFAGQDCCCSAVATVKEAMEDPHVAARGLFRGTVSGGAASLPALPVPVLPVFREIWRDKPSPALGADTDRLAPEVGRPF
jgi:crotonobetainyl-CoA:carnitine CoA-transferase CaiB-like acyl-CoA transferase